MSEEDDLLLDASDLSDIFGGDDAEAKPDEDLGKSIEDLFFTEGDDDSDDDDDDDLTLAVEARLSGLEEEADAASREAEEAARRAEEALAAARAAEEEAKRALAALEAGTEPDSDPEPEAPAKQAGMSDEEWKASPEYEEFKKQVIARHLKRKAEEDARQRAAQDDQAKAQAEQASAAAKAAAEQAAREAAKRAEEESAKAQKEKEDRAASALEAYKKAKADAAAKKAAESVKEEEKQKEQDFKARLADLKSKMASGEMAPKVQQAAAPQPAEAGGGVELDITRSQALAKMFEETRVVLMKLAADKIGKKPAKAMMKKTAMKASKPFAAVFGRADVDRKGEVRSDGALDEDRLSRNIYALPPEKRTAAVQKAFYSLLEIRFIAMEVGLGTRDQSVAISKALTILENSFKKQRYPADLVKWYFKSIIPDTVLADSDDGF